MDKNMKNKLKLIDNTFSHSKLGYCTDFQTSKIFEWDRSFHNEMPVVYTDMMLNHVNSLKENSYAWLIEPKAIAPFNYDLITKINNKFNKVFTHEKSLLDLGENYEFVPFGCCWIKIEDHKIYNKNRLISIIASNKKQTEGHKLRHNIINEFKSQIDVYGRGWNNLDYKLDGLKDYCFSIVIENCKRDFWFTEKLIDAIVCGTIPIYWGCPSIGEFFDTRGFILFNSLTELYEIINSLTEDKYYSMLPYIKYNFDKAKEFLIPDDWIYKKVFNI